ncbi:MAG: hypothetical protein H9993_04485 [Candidatus Desulfovibrio faecigallinarum]|uniref:hypothetical protein n=1 Tax=Desulfovibrio sp. An276 TaxID=1965618 RepID=UPI000B39EDC2|nr:hypothetical protein [Desulfovibrio sp. An276]MBU3831954.1 hypothetical protein [Candidatus Desulfovibrio faecigallinarum]OUO53794.1 hypothetical protein B5F76_04540 [Desulfovibrio sp. An276]
MEDANGIYYYPNPSLPQVRVYVRRAEDGTIEFRMWDAEHDEVWEKHGWISMDVVNAAIELFGTERGDNWHPEAIYDASVAEALLQDKERK